MTIAVIYQMRADAERLECPLKPPFPRSFDLPTLSLHSHLIPILSCFSWPSRLDEVGISYVRLVLALHAAWADSLFLVLLKPSHGFRPGKSTCEKPIRLVSSRLSSSLLVFATVLGV